MKTDFIKQAEELAEKARQTRLGVLDMVTKAKTGHTGSSLSCTDIMTTLFYGVLRCDPKNPKWPDRDRFVLSKGHAVETYYTILADLGFFPMKQLDTFCQYQTMLLGHPNNKIPGIEMNTGALGHGLPVAVGMALGARLDGAAYRVFTLMGDGELAEGSVWEAAMAAAYYKLGHVTAIIDRNRLQISGNTENVMALEPLNDKWKAFGWRVLEVDGHDHQALLAALKDVAPDQPTLVLANTVKGKGVPFMENVAHWHHGVPSEEQYKIAVEALGGETHG